MKEVRPTAGKTLGALFSILGPLSGMSFLDLFSGTGRVAKEARARGASIVGIFHDEATRKQVADRLHPMGISA